MRYNGDGDEGWKESESELGLYNVRVMERSLGKSRNNKCLYFSELLCQHWRLQYKVGMGFHVTLVLWGGDVR